VRLFSVRHEFPDQWYRFLNPSGSAAQAASIAFDLSAERFPYQFRGKSVVVNKVDIFLSFRNLYDPQSYPHNGTPLGEYAAASRLR
jgi:hypothetical protein